MDGIKKATNGRIFLLSNMSDFYQQPENPIVLSEPTALIANVKEPLLGFYGMSQFLPSSIYPILPDFPPFLQDFKYNFKQQEVRNCVVTGDADYITSLVPTGKLELTLESYNTFDQSEKELTTVELAWPGIESFESQGGPTEHPKVHCSTIRGKPDYVFIYLEHVYDKPGDNEGRNPKIEMLKMEIFGEDLNSISELDVNALYHLTRRNSHIHADVATNYRVTGAVLLTREDCMDFGKYKGFDGVDMFQLDVTVTSWEYATLDDQGSSGMESNDLDMKLKVLFIYKDYSLTGKLHDAKFQYA